MTSDIKERYLNNWSDDLNSEMWTGVEMIKFAASIRAETLEEAAKIADNFGPSRPLGVSASHSILCRGRWEGEQAASKNIAAAIRDAGKKE